MREPTAEKNDYEYKDASEIEIHEPRGKKVFAALGSIVKPSNVEGEDPIVIKQHMIYYFCVLAKKNTRLKVQAELCRVMMPQAKGKKEKKN